MRENERKVGRADHNPQGAQAAADGNVPSESDRADDSADQRTHGAHGRGRGEEQLNVDPPVEPDQTDGSDRGGSASWGSEGSGGSVVDKRRKKE
jgi:hypothetical protein